jgi:hypothetical protein
MTAVSYPDPKAAAAYLAKSEEECWNIPGIPKDFPMPAIKKVRRLVRVVAGKDARD